MDERKRLPRKIKIWHVLLGIVFIIAMVPLVIFLQIPSESTIRGCITTKMYEVELCPTSKDYVPLKKISKFVRRAVIASEDANFYQHEGFEWESIEKSFRENMEKGTYKRGGSTITQQLAKNMFLTKDKTLTRKGMEALITWKIEKTLSKDEILERYLNVIEYGQGIYGVKKAARHYFKKSASDVDVAEAAFLAMLLPNPVKYSTSFRKKDLTRYAKHRISSIVRDLHRSKQISESEYQAAVFKLEDFFGIKPQLVDEPEPSWEDPSSPTENFPDTAPETSTGSPVESTEPTLEEETDLPEVQPTEVEETPAQDF